MAAKRAAEKRAQNKELIKDIESKKEIMKSQTIDEAMVNVQSKMGVSKYPNIHYFFIDGKIMKCSLPGCKGFEHRMQWSKSAFLTHLNTKHNWNCYLEFYMMTFVMEKGKLRIMDVDELKKWFKDETERQMNTVPTKLWTTKVYLPWSDKIPNAVESENFKICLNSDEFQRKFRDTYQTTKWRSIFVVKDSSGLGSVYPNADELLKLLKEEEGDEEITFIDVHNGEFPEARRRDFVELFETPMRRRNTVYNNLQMEISHVPALRNSIVLPTFAREHCMFAELGWKGTPRYERYVLLTQSGAFTDFHIDLGGFSNYFHVLKGIKIFYFVEPTETNLALFEDYHKNHLSEGGINWFGNKNGVEIRKVILTAGCTSFMPSGWIHAVYTAEDTIAVSGSYFESSCIPMQIQVYELEDKIEIDEMHRVEEFVSVHAKYLVKKLLRTVKENNDSITSMILTSKLAWTWESFRKLLAFVDKMKKKKEHKSCITESQLKSCQVEEKRQLDLQGRTH